MARRDKRRQYLNKKLIPPVLENWGAIRSATAKSLGYKGKAINSFLPPKPDMAKALGCGFWGCVFPTADPRFVVKVSIDLTEGPHVSLARALFPLHPGLAYFHRIWQLPKRVWTDEFGSARVWIMLREETDLKTKYKPKTYSPAKGYSKVYNALSELPACCSCLNYLMLDSKRSLCDPHEVAEAEAELRRLMRLTRTPGEQVGKLIVSAWDKHKILLGDVHYENVGTRIHDLSEFGVKRHKKLVVTDLGSWHQAPITTDRYPAVPYLPGAKRT